MELAPRVQPDAAANDNDNDAVEENFPGANSDHEGDNLDVILLVPIG